jgi:hypothetical protein
MKAPTEVKFSFDPIKAGVVSFGNDIAKIIYCCVRKGHIVDDRFDDQVFVFSEKLLENMPEFYNDFKKMVAKSNLNQFGRRTIREFGFRHETILDDNFWIGVWEYINKWETLDIVLEF